VSSSVHRQRDMMEKQVIMMGFNPEVVEYAAIKVNHRGVEGIIEYLTGRDDVTGLYIHDFVKMPNEEELRCLLCNENVDMHRIEFNNSVLEEEINQE
jgi:hypothetical protein